MVKKSFLVTALSMALCGIAHAEQDIVVITTKVSFDKNVEDDLFTAMKEVGKKLTKDLGALRGVTEVETTVDSECSTPCKKEDLCASECGSIVEESTPSADIHCDACDKVVKNSTSSDTAATCASCPQ